jgi:hypothetical protein
VVVVEEVLMQATVVLAVLAVVQLMVVHHQ